MNAQAALRERPEPRARGATLAVEGIGHAFGGLQVLKEVDFPVAGEGITGLIGPNGSGKTTLFNIITGFLRPLRGTVRLDGRDVTSSSVQERSRQGLLRTFQTPKVFEHISVLENVMMGAYAHTGAGFLSSSLLLPSARREFEEVRQTAISICRRFEIEHLAGEAAGRLPAGQRRIVEIARAYCARPRILLLDEPSSGLSTPEIAQLRRWIEALNREGITILLVSHNMGLMSVCEHVHVLHFGRIIASGSMEQVRADKAVRDAYLGG